MSCEHPVMDGELNCVDCGQEVKPVPYRIADPHCVFIIYAVYGDRSGVYILGVYSSKHEAEDRVAMLKAAGSYMSAHWVKVPINVVFPVELSP